MNITTYCHRVTVPILLLCSVFLLPSVAAAAAFQTGPCTQSPGATQICSFADPEDMVKIPGTKWILVSEQGDQPGSSGFALIDTKTLRVTGIKASDIEPGAAPQCLGAFHLGGIGLRREGGVLRLVAIEHGADKREAVASFDVDAMPAIPTLKWAGCALAPAPLFLNSITALPSGGFAATHMFDRTIAAKDPAAQKQRFLAKESTGYAVMWSASGGWQKIPNSDGSFPNGIDSSLDGKTLYMAETYGHRIDAFALDGSNRRSVPVAMQPDNVRVTDKGEVIVAGGTGIPIVSTEGCAKFRPQGCGFPSAVVRIEFGSASVSKLFSDDGTKVPGASVGLLTDGKLFIGTSFGDRVTVVSR